VNAPDPDAWGPEPTACPECGRESCEGDCLPPEADPVLDPADIDHEVRVRAEVERQRIDREARQRLDSEERGPVPGPEFRTLRERLAVPRSTVRYRIDGFQPAGTRVICAAQFKAGKTTLIGNLLRSLADGDAFLGSYRVSPLVGTVALIDTEMGPTQLDDWLRVQAIGRDDGVIVVTLRGRVASFDLLDRTLRTRWAQWLRERRVDYLVLDCLRPVLDALGLDEHRDAGRFLTAFDALLAEAEITDALVVQHMGHLNERSRGDSRLRDWPDVEWQLVREDDDPGSPRFIKAYGRDVDVREARLDYDQVTRRLLVSGGSRGDVKVESALAAVLDVLTERLVPMSGRAIKDALVASDHPRDTIDSALRRGVEAGVLRVEPGSRNARLYSKAPECPGVSG
jgi:hypothetical protein